MLPIAKLLKYEQLAICHSVEPGVWTSWYSEQLPAYNDDPALLVVSGLLEVEFVKRETVI